MSELTQTQRDDLRTIAALIIPPSEEYRVPGADDEAIQADILATLGRDAGPVAAALDRLARLAGMPLADLDAVARDGTIKQFREGGGGPALDGQLGSLGGDPVEIDYAPFRECAALLYGGPWVAERLAAIESFVGDHADAMDPTVRTIVEGARSYSAVDAFPRSGGVVRR